MMKEFLRQQIFPGFSAIASNKVVHRFYLKQIGTDVFLPERADINELQSSIEDLLKKQLERKSKLEDKAKSLLFIITLAITTATFSLNFLKETPDRLFSPILAILSICCFVFAGIRVISAINIRMFHIYETPINYEKGEDDDGNTYERIAVGTDHDVLTILVRNKVLNDLICTKIANLTYASFVLVRNGIILFACFFAVSITFLFSTTNSNAGEKKQKKNKTHIVIKHKATTIKGKDSVYHVPK